MGSDNPIADVSSEVRSPAVALIRLVLIRGAGEYSGGAADGPDNKFEFKSLLCQACFSLVFCRLYHSDAGIFLTFRETLLII